MLCERGATRSAVAVDESASGPSPRARPRAWPATPFSSIGTFLAATPHPLALWLRARAHGLSLSRCWGDAKVGGAQRSCPPRSAPQRGQTGGSRAPTSALASANASRLGHAGVRRGRAPSRAPVVRQPGAGGALRTSCGAFRPIHLWAGRPRPSFPASGALACFRAVDRACRGSPSPALTRRRCFALFADGARHQDPA